MVLSVVTVMPFDFGTETDDWVTGDGCSLSLVKLFDTIGEVDFVSLRHWHFVSIAGGDLLLAVS